VYFLAEGSKCGNIVLTEEEKSTEIGTLYSVLSSNIYVCHLKEDQRLETNENALADKVRICAF
jgi:hypothetical protein